MSKIVFDSSVLIAIFKQEPGCESAENSLNEALISTVNLAEVASYLARNSVPAETIKEALAAFPIEIVPFEKEQALMAGCLYVSCKHLGLSLGDRACLALAKSKNLPVLTADRVGSNRDLGLSIQTIR